LPLHGAALRRDDGYVVLLGSSGKGKSTLSAALRQRGWAMASDDVSAIALVDGRPVLHPGYPESKMWPDALALINEPADKYPRLRAVDDKRRVRVDNFSPESAEVGALVLISTSDAPEPTMVRSDSPGFVMAALKGQVYRGEFSVRLGAHRDQFATLAALAEHVPVFQLDRPVSGADPAALALLVESQVEAHES
jgi:hypothetical protein